MEMIEEDGGLSIPKGGPIYVPNIVGPITRVPDFRASLLRQLQDLEVELCLDSSSVPGDDDVSIDDLKIFTEGEIADMAMREAFKDPDDQEKISKQPSEENPCSGRRKGNSKELSDKNDHSEGCGRGENTSTAIEYSNRLLSGANCNGTMTKSKTRKKKKIKSKSNATEDGYIVKVEQLAKLKQKQDEDKAAARLHSLQTSCRINECVTPSSERIERLKSLRSTNSATKPVKSSNIQDHVAVLYPEVVLCVEIYHNIRKWSKVQEFMVLGQQPLTELRDKIYCLTDQMMKKAGLHDPSGYFLIEDVFCNDLRDPSAIDYSEPIFDWLRNSKDDSKKKWECILTGELQRKQKAVLGEVTTSHLPHFKAVDMRSVRFCDLRFRLGAGYLYCHQGDCKHTIVIRDMRLIHPEDVHSRAAYPLVTFQLKPRVQKCNVCKIYRATKMTVDDKWAEENPCYFCDYCYSLLHSEDGSPMCNDVLVYDYLHD